MPKLKHYPVVRVEWVDAEADNGWRTEDEVRNEQVGRPVTTIGYLIRKPSKGFAMYMVASTIAIDEGSETWLHQGIMKIPKQWVKSLTHLNLEEKTNDKQSDYVSTGGTGLVGDPG